MENVGSFVDGGDRVIGGGMKFIMDADGGDSKGKRFVYKAGEERL
jgi:hypothetical protein